MAQDLTALKVKNLVKGREVGRRRVSDNLYIQIAGNRGACWLYRYMRDGTAHWMGLGKYRDNLAEARARALEIAESLDKKIDPLAERRKQWTDQKIADAKAITFGECARALIKAKAPEWKNDKHAAQWYASFERTKRSPAATADINGVPISEVNTAMALKVLEPIWTTKPETCELYPPTLRTSHRVGHGTRISDRGQSVRMARASGKPAGETYGAEEADGQPPPSRLAV